jgi:hypothetical protein
MVRPSLWHTGKAFAWLFIQPMLPSTHTWEASPRPHRLAVLRKVDQGCRRVRLHARLAEVAHDRHERGQDARVLGLLQPGAQVRAQLPQRLASRPADLGVRVRQPLRAAPGGS